MQGSSGAAGAFLKRRALLRKEDLDVSPAQSSNPRHALGRSDVGALS